MLHNTNPYESLGMHQYICNMLLTNPVLFIGETEQTIPSFQEFAFFRAKDIQMTSLGEDILILVPIDSKIYDNLPNKEILSFTAFYLPYEKNRVVSTIVPQDAQIILTPSLSGCSFVGELNSPTPLIAHINRIEHDETNQEKMDVDIDCITNNGNNFFIVRKPDYYDESNESTTLVFGLKLKNKWQFTCQSAVNNHITQTISTIKKQESILSDQESRNSLIKYRDNLFAYLFENAKLFTSDNFEKNIRLTQYSRTQTLSYCFWVPAYIYQSLKIIERATKGQLRWKKAEQLLTLIAEHCDTASSLTDFSIFSAPAIFNQAKSTHDRPAKKLW